MLLGAESLPDLPAWELASRLGLAVALGGIIGVERELREREAGLRTHMLVALGSALFTIVSAYGFHELLSAGGPLVTLDPTRIAAQIVTGIGFLGAGAIIRQGFSVRGLTTAATLWMTAAIGMAAGAGFYSAAVLTTAIALFSLWPLRIWAHRALDRFHERRITLTLTEDSDIAPVIEKMEQLGVEIESFAFGEDGDKRTLTALIDLPGGLERTALLRQLASLPEVKGVQWGTV
jgi:putative Mg2+ transporter-C (MgtC) family protein